MPNSKDPRFQDYLDEYRIPALENLQDFPKFIQLETVSGCNARCTMCSVDSWTRSRSVLPEPLFQRLVDEIGSRADWVEQVTLQMGGEPLLDRKLEQHVAELKRVGVRSVAFTTNASLLTEERARGLLDAGIDAVDFSLDGATRQTFETIRVNLSYEAVRGNVLRFLALREEMGKRVAVRVRMVVQEANAHEFDRFVEDWRPRLGPQDRVLGRFLNWWVTWKQDLAGVPGRLLRADRDAVDLNSLPCLAPFSTLIVLSDGRVPLCCLDYNADTQMGNLLDSGIAEVWRSPAFQAVRLKHLAHGRNAMAFCRDCHIFATGSGFDFAGTAGQGGGKLRT